MLNLVISRSSGEFERKKQTNLDTLVSTKVKAFTRNFFNLFIDEPPYFDKGAIALPHTVRQSSRLQRQRLGAESDSWSD